MKLTKFFVKIISTTKDIKISIIQCDSEAYEKTISLRDDVLRKPLGLIITNKDIKNDCNEIIFAVFHNEKVIGVAHLSCKSNSRHKLRQMAISKEFQKKGIGTFLLKFILTYAKTHNMNTIYLHARKTALIFHKKLGFKAYGNFFEEVSVTHKKMKISIS